ncbi:MAG TPA: hypothetical protein PKV43_13800, partial [Armatimonadota bacterium]|nr:hypothetical protein [Armatimonadota bacterium]
MEQQIPTQQQQIPPQQAAQITQTKQATKPLSIEDAHVDDMLRVVVEKGASDLHLCVGVPPIIRVDGQLLPLNYEKLNPLV